MARLEHWAESALKVVDEKGDHTARIRLVTADGATWQTWVAPFAAVEDWLAEAQGLISELAGDFSGEVAAMFVAESSAGVVRSQCPQRIAGKLAKGGVAGFSGGGPGGAPLHQMYEAQAKTVERTLQSANVQLEVLTRTVEKQAKANGELLDYIRLQNEHAALDRQEGSSEVREILGQLLEQAPLLFELLKAKSSNAAKSAVKTAAANAVGQGAANVASALLDTIPKGTN